MSQEPTPTRRTTDHAQKAAQHIDWTHEWQAEVGSTEETNLANAMLAQAHATLAVAHELKTANLIAWIELRSPSGIPLSLIDTLQHVKARLGLAGGAE